MQTRQMFTCIVRLLKSAQNREGSLLKSETHIGSKSVLGVWLELTYIQFPKVNELIIIIIIIIIIVIIIMIAIICITIIIK